MIDLPFGPLQISSANGHVTLTPQGTQDAVSVPAAACPDPGATG